MPISQRSNHTVSTAISPSDAPSTRQPRTEDAHPCLRYRDGGSRAAGAERISGRGKPHPEEPVEWAIEALGRRASHAREDGHRLGRQALAEVATVARPDTILAWYRCRRRRSASARPHGRPSFGATWRCWLGLTSSPAEVLTLRGLVTYYVLFFIHLESRRVDIAGITIHPDEPWMRQIARNVTMEGCGPPCASVAISCTIGTLNTPNRSGLLLCQVALNRWCCRRAART
jgi:hypothetical protein